MIAFQTAEVRAWWEIVLGAGAAIATIAVTFFAGVQLWREVRRTKRQQKDADARASAKAYRLRRQLQSWRVQDGVPPFEDWISNARTHSRYTNAIDRAEELVIQLSELAGETSEDVRAGIEEAYMLFLAGTRRLNEHLNASKPREGEVFAWRQLLSDAGEDLRACIAVLERRIIAAGLLSAERENRRLRESQDLLGSIEAEMEERDVGPEDHRV